MLRAAIQVIIYLFIHAVILFGSAGRIDWVMAWMYLFIHAASIIIIFCLGDTEMIKIRSHKEKGVKYLVIIKIKDWHNHLLGGEDVKNRYARFSLAVFTPLSSIVAAG